MNKKLYLVYYTMGTHEDFMRQNIFVTFNKSMAEKYCKKFNQLRGKCKEYYRGMTDSDGGWIKTEYESHLERWLFVMDLGECTFKEIELR